MHEHDKGQNTLIEKTNLPGIFKCSGAGTNIMPNIANVLSGVGVGRILFMVPGKREGLPDIDVLSLTLDEDKKTAYLSSQAAPTMPADPLNTRRIASVKLTREKR